MKLILASLSERRRDILKNNNFDFEIIDSMYDENFSCQNPYTLTKTLSENKAMNVFASHSDCVVLAADTIVCFKGRILGKPKNEEDARETLKMLSGNTHKVITGYTIISKNKTVTKAVTSFVVFNKLTDETIDKYIASGMYKGKAGSYGIQDGFGLIKKHIGDYDNIVGLPIKHIEKKLRKMLNEI